MCVAMHDVFYNDIVRFAKRHNFTVSELIRAAVLLAIADQPPSHDGEDCDEEIARMFDQYKDHQRQPDGTVPVRIHHKTINEEDGKGQRLHETD